MKSIQFQEIVFKHNEGSKLEVHIEKYGEKFFRYSVFLYEKQSNGFKAQIFEIESRDFFNDGEKAFIEAQKHLSKIIKNRKYKIIEIDNPCNTPFVSIEFIKQETKDLNVDNYKVNGVSK